MFIRPLYVTELGGNPVQVGQVLGVMGLAPLLVMLPVGRLADRFGPRVLMLIGWWLGAVATVFLALAPDWRWLIPGFFFYYLSGFAIPAINAYVALDLTATATDSASSRSMQEVIARVYAAYFAGTIVSPVIGGWLGGHFGLRTVFWVSAAWFAVSTLVVHGVPRLEGGRPAPHSGELLPAGSPLATGRPAPWWRFTAAQWRVFGMLLVLFFFLALGYALVPSYLEDVRGLPVSVIGGLGAPMAAGGTFWLLVLGRLRSRLALVTATGLVMLALAGLLYGPEGLLALILIYFLLGAYLTVRTLSLDIVSACTPPELRGTSFGLLETLFGIGAFLGPLMAGVLYAGSPRAPFLVGLVALMVLLGVSWVVLAPVRRAGAPGQQPAAPVSTPVPGPDVRAQPAAPQTRPGIDSRLCK